MQGGKGETLGLKNAGNDVGNENRFVIRGSDRIDGDRDSLLRGSKYYILEVYISRLGQSSTFSVLLPSLEQQTRLGPNGNSDFATDSSVTHQSS